MLACPSRTWRCSYQARWGRNSPGRQVSFANTCSSLPLSSVPTAKTSQGPLCPSVVLVTSLFRWLPRSPPRGPHCQHRHLTVALSHGGRQGVGGGEAPPLTCFQLLKNYFANGCATVHQLKIAALGASPGKDAWKGVEQIFF